MGVGPRPALADTAGPPVHVSVEAAVKRGRHRGALPGVSSWLRGMGRPRQETGCAAVGQQEEAFRIINALLRNRPWVSLAGVTACGHGLLQRTRLTAAHSPLYRHDALPYAWGPLLSCPFGALPHRLTGRSAGHADAPEDRICSPWRVRWRYGLYPPA